MTATGNIEKRKRAKPARLFFYAAVATLIISFIYFRFFPESYFDLNVGTYFTISSGLLWLLFSGYLLLLASIYFVAARGTLTIRSWLIGAHYVFVLLFLLVFLVFSQFNERYVRELLQTNSAATVFLIYSVIFLIDALLFLTSMVLLVANLVQMARAGRRAKKS